MKIYCILLDSLDHNKKVKKFFKDRDLHYARYITNSYTTATLSAMFSGLPSALNGMQTSGYNRGYLLRSKANRDIADSSSIFNQLPKDWTIHIHGDQANYKFITNNCCSIKKDPTIYIHTNYKNEIEFVKSMQQDLPLNENHFIFIKYNHLHDVISSKDLSEKAVDRFVDILKSINYAEANSLFWTFADHGNYTKVDKYMEPPHSWLTWASVVDNITNKKVIKNPIHMQDFYNTVYNRAYEDMISNSNYDVLSKDPNDRIYICDDGRSNVDGNKHTTLSAIKCLNEDTYLQVMYHSPENLYKYTLFDAETNSIQNATDKKFEKDIKDMTNYMKTNYGGYFND